jgi:hypothetical protein
LGTETGSGSGTDVKILKIFSPKKIAKTWHFLTKNTVSLFKKIIEKNANNFAEKGQKLQ